MKIKKMSLITRLIIAIVIGILIGYLMPLWFCRFIITLAGLFSSFLKFVIPLMILSYVTVGIADLSQGAGKLLFITVLITYSSSLISGIFSFMVSKSLFRVFISPDVVNKIQTANNNPGLSVFFEISIPPVLDTISSVVLAFVFGLWLSSTKNKGNNNTNRKRYLITE